MAIADDFEIQNDKSAATAVPTNPATEHST